MQDFLTQLRGTLLLLPHRARVFLQRSVHDGLRNQTNDRQDYRRCKVV